MYLLFRCHHITPNQYFEMGFGERQVIRAFMHYEIEQKNEENEKLKNKMR